MVGRFKYFDHPQTCRTIIDGCSIIQDAINEVFKFDLQSLALFDSGRPHISRTVTHEQFIDALPVGDLHAFIVDLNFLVGLEIVPDQHLFFTADQSGSNLDRRKPVDVDVGDHVAGKVDSDEGHVRQTVYVLPTRRDDRSAKSSYVFALANGRAARRDVHIGQERESQLEIVDGLRPGDQVIAEQNIEIAQGVRVEPRR